MNSIFRPHDVYVFARRSMAVLLTTSLQLCNRKRRGHDALSVFVFLRSEAERVVDEDHVDAVLVPRKARDEELTADCVG